MITLALETSCDETSVAVLEGGRKVLSNVISSQIQVHEVFGGVVPEIASRHHLTNINPVIDQALSDAGKSLGEIDLIGVTCGPGLVGALIIGIATAKAISLAKDIPLVGVHHIQGHVSANYIEHHNLKPPFLGLVVSGGHTHLIDVNGYNSFQVIGKTRDDAAGEAFDKVARVLGLGYPGGPKIDAIAKKGDPDRIPFKRIYLEKDSLDFSFSGLKTGVLNYLNSRKLKGEEICVEDVAASFQMAVVEVIVNKAILAAKEMKKERIVLAGGVAANSLLRSMLSAACNQEGIDLYYPSVQMCTDNGAMIGCAAYYKYIEGYRDGLGLNAYAQMSIENLR